MEVSNSVRLSEECSNTCSNSSTNNSPSKEELNEKLIEHKKKIRVLQQKQKVRRKERRISDINNLLQDLKSKELLKGSQCDNLRSSFAGLSADVIINHFNNQLREAKGYRHNDEVKKFALTLHFYSPRAYEYVRSIFCLPRARSLLNWSSSVKCEPVFFENVFLHVRNLVLDGAKNAECSLIFDAMTIKKGVIFNKSKGCYQGFVVLGENIVACGEDDTVATEALIFMISALQSYWKYPIGYVLIDKINADNLYCLLFNLSCTSVTTRQQSKSSNCDM